MGSDLIVGSLILFVVVAVVDVLFVGTVAALRGRGLLFRAVLMAAINGLSSAMIAFWIGEVGLKAWTIVVGVVIGSLAGVAVVLVIQRTVVRPVEALTQAAQELAVGDLRVAITHHSRDEVGRLARAMAETVAYQQALASVAGQLAEGDLTVEVAPRGEWDVLGLAFAQVVVRLRELVGTVQANAAQLGQASQQLVGAANQSSAATTQIAATMQQVAKGAAQQTRSVTRTAQSVDQMKKAIDGVAEGAKEQARSVGEATEAMSLLSKAVDSIHQGAIAQAQGMARATESRVSLADALSQVTAATDQVSVEAQQAARAAGEGTALVSQTVEGIQKVRGATDQLAERVRGLGQQSAQIGAIIETIDEIASQTNLLALNAAIEAARAGEHGEGFAVVADEVRKLAERASLATKEIGGMVRTIQTEAHEAVEAMGQAGANVSAAVTLTDQAGAAFREIAAKSQGSADRMAGVREAVAAMRQADEQLERAVAEATTIAHQNQAAAEAMGQLNNRMVTSLDTVSAIVEQTTATADTMTIGADVVAQKVENISSVCEENGAAVEEVSAGSEELAAQAEEVTAAAQSLSGMAEALQAVVEQFRMEADPARPQPGAPNLMGQAVTVT